MEGKQVLVVPRNSGLTKEDRDALREANIIVVVVRTPHEVRMLSAERLPIDSNEMLRTLIRHLASYQGYGSSDIKSSAFIAIAKAIEANAATTD